jgi:hypothetical protein
VHARVRPAHHQPEQARRKRRHNLDAALPEPAGQLALQEHLTANGINQDPARHPAFHGAGEGSGQFVGPAPGAPDVELEVAGPARPVDVGDQRRKGDVGVFQELELVAG